jgi:hypothetical protein
MKLPYPVLLLCSLVGSLFVASCAIPEVPRRQPFHEADFVWAGRSGNGTVEGRAFTVLRNGEIWYANNSRVTFFPVNAYDTEAVMRLYERGENLAYADDRASPYIREIRTDRDGYFSLHGLPPGEYYVGTTAPYDYWYWNDDGTKNTVHKFQYIYATITVRNGQTTHIHSWNQGAAKRWGWPD